MGTVTVAVVPVATVTLVPSAFSLTPGGTQTLTATVKDSSGNVLVGKVVTFSSSNTSIATVNSAGVVTGVSQGSATITATSEGKTATAAATITAAAVSTVVVSPASFTVEAGSTYQLTATPKDVSGTVLIGRTVVWGSGTPAKATVSSSGLVTGVAGGAVTITATCETKTGSSSGTVTVPGVDTFPEILAALPTGLTHNRATDLIEGELFPTAVDVEFPRRGEFDFASHSSSPAAPQRTS